MRTFRITEQTASVVERSYDVEGEDEDDAQDAFESDRAAHEPVHEETLRQNREIVGVEVNS